MPLSNLALEFTERGIVPDRLVRAGIRRLLQSRLDEIAVQDPAAAAAQA
jgi:cyclopropane-fatty-acyl-phospholipid synthase